MSAIASVANKILNTKWMTCLTSPNAPAAASTIANISCITKDAVNCYYYTTQSLHNDKIPAEKRKFVAGLDLANGVLNVVLQFVAGKLVTDHQNKIFDKTFGKFFKPENLKTVFKDNVSQLPGYTEASFLKSMKNYEQMAKTGFGVFITLAVTQIFVKRVMTPFLATPMASFIKQRFEKNELKAKQLQDNTKFSGNVAKQPAKTSLPDCYKSFAK